MFNCIFTDETKYDKDKYEEILKYLGKDSSKLFGTPINTLISTLDLTNVEWNYGYTNMPNGEVRIYHFDGFYLFLHLEILPKDIDFNKRKQYSSTFADLKKNGVRYLSSFNSFVRIDGIEQSDKRLTEYWASVYKGFENREKNSKK